MAVPAGPRTRAQLADGTWIVSRYTDVASLLRSRALSSEQHGGLPGGPAASLADRRHVAFGGGAHLCLGAPLARLEVSVALRELARRLPSLRAAGESTWRPRLAFRGRAVLPVSLAA